MLDSRQSLIYDSGSVTDLGLLSLFANKKKNSQATLYGATSRNA